MFDLERVVTFIPALVIGLVFHEYAHGWMAKRLGDRTAERAGRLTLNPGPHLDPVGSILLPLALLLLPTGFVFGWAKPVPVNPYNFRGDIKQGMMLVSVAGPGANLLVAFTTAVTMGVVAGTLGPGSVLMPILNAIVLLNLVLAFFNLLPVPPLDGSKILAGLLPGPQEWLYSLERYGIIILFVLIFTGAISVYFSLVIRPAYGIMINIANSIARFFGI